MPATRSFSRDKACRAELRAWVKRSGRKLIAFDFDGTLAPPVMAINENTFSSENSALLDALIRMQQHVCAIVSGRSLETLHAFLGRRENLFLCGNHGVEMVGPALRFLHEEAVACARSIGQLYADLHKNLAAYGMIEYEIKPYSAALLYRGLSSEEEARVQHIIRRRAEAYPQIKLLFGSAVTEICANVPWHKGYAVNFLAQKFAIEPENIFFAGDEVNDELAFDMLPHGMTLKVGTAPTSARFRIEEQREMRDVLRILAQID